MDRGNIIIFFDLTILILYINIDSSTKSIKIGNMIFIFKYEIIFIPSIKSFCNTDVNADTEGKSPR